MKRKSIYNTFLRGMFLPILLFVITSCIFEYPEQTESGELGIDPTKVNVNLNVVLDLKMTDNSNSWAMEPASSYRHRIIVEAYLDSKLVIRQTLYKAITAGVEQTSVNTNLNLHASDYRLIVWADFVKADSEEDLYYNTTTLVPAINQEPYVGNAAYKDVLYGSQTLQLSCYRDESNKQENIRMDLKRPVARYELVANDVKKFLKKITNGKVNGDKFTVNVRYTDYFFTGFNALNEIAKNALKDVFYSRIISIPEDGTDELCIAFDYVFVFGDGIPMAVEILDENDTLLACTYLILRCKADEIQIVRSNFLTANSSGGGVNFDIEYDDTINDKVEAE